MHSRWHALVPTPISEVHARTTQVFPAPPGMGATFNLSLAHAMGVTIGTEARAMNNVGGCRARGGGGCGWGNGNWYIGLNVWVPNLNIYRDPRWGRNVEVCPCH